jgi:hypothetical protein
MMIIFESLGRIRIIIVTSIIKYMTEGETEKTNKSIDRIQSW